MYLCMHIYIYIYILYARIYIYMHTYVSMYRFQFCLRHLFVAYFPISNMGVGLIWLTALDSRCKLVAE